MQNARGGGGPDRAPPPPVLESIGTARALLWLGCARAVPYGYEHLAVSTDVIVKDGVVPVTVNDTLTVRVITPGLLRTFPAVRVWS